MSDTSLAAPVVLSASDPKPAVIAAAPIAVVAPGKALPEAVDAAIETWLFDHFSSLSPELAGAWGVARSAVFDLKTRLAAIL